MAKTIGHTSSGKPVYAAFQLHPNFAGWTAVDHWDAADVHEAAKLVDIKTNVSMHENSAALHSEEAQQIVKAVEKLGLGRGAKTPRHHSTRKSGAQLDREIAQSVGKRIERKKLGEMMSPWGGSSAYGEGTGAIGAVSSYYYSGMKYPDRESVARALKAIEADIPKAEHGAHGWTKSDAKDLRTIAQGLRYYLIHDYSGEGRAHSTIKSDEQWEAQVTERRKRDPGAWSSREKLVAVARGAAQGVFSGRKVMTPALIKKAKEAAWKAIQRYDPLAGTKDHPAAAYSHGVAEIAAEGTAQAERLWVPEKKIPYGTWAKAGAKLVSHDRRFAIMKSNGGYNLIDLDTYNEYPAASLEEAKSKARSLRY